MDKADDQKRYFVFGSAVCEVVTPVIRQKLRDKYTGQGIADFQTFLNHQPVRHILFHLRYKDKHCCTDRPNCYNHTQPPLAFFQWKQLYSTSTSPICGRSCHCKFIANGVDLDAIDLTLASLLVLELCGLSQDEVKAVQELRHFKNNFLSHTINGCIEKHEFDSLWADLVANTLTLDPTKQDELIRILNRPLDARLCEKYRIELVEVQKKLNEIDEKLDQRFGTCTIPELLQEIKDIKEHFGITSGKKLEQGQTQNGGFTAKNQIQKQEYRLGQNIFHPQYTEIDLRTLAGKQVRGVITGILITDDDRIVLSLHDMKSLLICNSDGSGAYTIPLEGKPWGVTTITDSTVAVTLPYIKTVAVYDINRRVKVRTIPVPGQCWGITTINNRLVVGGIKEIWMEDLQTGKIINTIQNDDVNCILHTSGDRFFSCHQRPYLTCYNQTGEKLYTTTSLPSDILYLTSLQDGSLYVTCRDDKVYHVSSDGQNYQPVQTEGLNRGYQIRYNQNTQKHLFRGRGERIINIFLVYDQTRQNVEK